MMLRRVEEIFLKSPGCYRGVALKEEMGLYTLRQAKSQKSCRNMAFAPSGSHVADFLYHGE